MVPVYDSDVAHERWSKSEWNHYELWEKVEQRIRRHNRLWIAATALVFVLLSSIPIILDQRPHWIALAATRNLGQEISRMKRDAAVEHVPFRLRFFDDGSVSYQVERVQHCDDPTGVVVRNGSLVSPKRAADYELLSRKLGESVSIPGLLQEFCYDPLQGSMPFVKGESDTGFAVAPARDLTAGRLDRLSILLMSGPTAELSLE